MGNGMGSSTASNSRTKRDQNSIATLAVIGLVIVAIVAGLYFYMDWQRNRPGTPPEQIEVTAAADGDEATAVSTLPFSVCEFGAECPEGTVATVSAHGAENVRITVPREVSEQQWQLLSIYDDPAANSERAFTPGETDEVDVPVVNDGANLVVVEVSTFLVGHDQAGEETPVMVTWAFSTDAP